MIKNNVPLKLYKTVAILCASLFIFGCGQESSTTNDEGTLTIFSSIAPIKGIVEDIGGEYVNVNSLVPTGQNPHLFELSPKQMVQLSKAKAYFTIGMQFESSIKNNYDNIAKVRFIDIATGVERRHIEKHSEEHGHDHHQCSHSDPHIWLGYEQLKVLAKNVYEQLCSLEPLQKKYFTTNYQKYLAELEIVHSQIQVMLDPYKGSSIMVFHPSFGYFTDTYGLEQNAIEFEGKAPTPKHFAELIGKSQGTLRVLFIQPQFEQTSSLSIAKTVGAEIRHIDSLAPDIRENMLEIAKKIEIALQKGNK